MGSEFPGRTDFLNNLIPIFLISLFTSTNTHQEHSKNIPIQFAIVAAIVIDHLLTVSNQSTPSRWLPSSPGGDLSIRLKCRHVNLKYNKSKVRPFNFAPTVPKCISMRMTRSMRRTISSWIVSTCISRILSKFGLLFMLKKR